MRPTDAYVRLGGHESFHVWVPSGDGGTVFVDVEPDPTNSWDRFFAVSLRALPIPMLADSRVIAFRFPDFYEPRGGSRFGKRKQSAGAEIRDAALQAAQVLCPQATILDLRQPVGAAATLDLLQGVELDDSGLISRLRSVEIAAMLDRGRALWQSNSHHYRLPSGEHSRRFLRVTDAVRGVRDAEVLASWLHADVSSGTGLVADTAGLAPVVLALEKTLVELGMRLGPKRFLPNYPSRAFDVNEAVASAATGGSVVGILSVSGGGGLRDRLLGALASVRGGKLHAVVDGSAGATHPSFGGFTKQYIHWYPRPGFDPIELEVVRAGSACPFCKDPAMAAVVPIMPGTMQAGEAEGFGRHSLSLQDAGRNRSFWDMLNAHCFTSADTTGVVLNSGGHVAVRKFRNEKTLPLAFPVSDWVSQPQGRIAAARALATRVLANTDGAGVSVPDVLLVPAHEADIEGHDRFVSALGRELGWAWIPPVQAFPAVGPWSRAVLDEVVDPKHLIVLALGTVSGSSLHGALARIQAERAPRSYRLDAMVAHARPSDWRTWKSLKNAYADRLHAGWLTYFDDADPFAHERAWLSGLPSAVRSERDGREDFITSRQQQLTAADWGSGASMFWAEPSGIVLSPNSLFGDSLSPRAVLAAVGSAVQAERQRKSNETGGVLQVFDLTVILRSYFDPLIVCAVLRWLEAHEMWWGRDDLAAAGLIQYVIERTKPEHQPMLVAELSLAASQGKLDFAKDLIAEEARRLLDSATGSSNADTIALELGLAMLAERKPRQTDPTMSEVASALRKARLDSTVLDRLIQVAEDRDTPGWLEFVAESV